MSKNLFEDNSDSDNVHIQLKTNAEYAKSYNKFRQKELLKKFKDRDDCSEDSDSTSSGSSEDEVVDKKFDEKFYKALSSLKSKDPKIYEKDAIFFADDYDNASTINGDGHRMKPKKKSLTVKEYERKVILEKGGVYEDEENSDDQEENLRPLSPTYVEEQNILKDEIKNALKDSDDSEEEEFGAIFKKRIKTTEEKDAEEDDYTKWLSGQKDDIGEAGQSLKPLKEYWSNPNLPKQEKFLRDYILNNGYATNHTDEIPTYDEIVGDDNISDDEKEVERQAEFEHKFNFRFEEPDKEFIKRYPRTIESSVRRVDDKRKIKRQEVKDRKLQEKEQKYQELQMLKTLKKKEIEEKIQKLKEVTGNDELPFKNDDLEDEFDPESYDKRMQEVFNEEFYQVDEGEEKPECPDIEDLKVEDWDNYDPENEDEFCGDYEMHCEDEDFNMDCDYDPNNKAKLQDELIQNTKSNRNKRKRRNRFMEMIKTEKPAFNPDDERTYAEYIDEYYKMDYEDLIGDVPCRFKYVETVPNDFGLTIEEILLAKNKELNQWASLKKAVQIRSEHVEKNEAKMYRIKAQNEALKRKIFQSLYEAASDEEENTESSNNVSKVNTPKESETKLSKKKLKKKRKACETVTQNTDEPQQAKQIKLDNNASKSVGETAEININKFTPNKEVDESVKGKFIINTSSVLDKKKKRKKKKKTQNSSDVVKDALLKGSINNSNKKDKSKNPFKSSNITTKRNTPNLSNDNIYSKLSDERLQAYGINPKKYRKKQMFLNHNKKASSNKSTSKKHKSKQ